MENLIGLGYSFGYVFLVILLAEISGRFIHNQQVTRKIIHILCGNWIFMAFSLFNSVWVAIIPPIVFIFLNYISYRKDLIPSMEGKKSMGTVYYAISLFILTLLGWLLKFPAMALVGILSMAYGDGFAAVIGEKYGVVKWQNSEKSYVGSIVVFGITLLISLIISLFYTSKSFSIEYWGISFIISLVVALYATYSELNGDNGLDNLFLPIGVGILYFYLVFIFQQSINYIVASAMIVVLTIIILKIAIYKGAITSNGAGVALLLAIILFCHGSYMLYGEMILFFVIGSLTSKYKKREKQEFESLHQKSGARNWIQVLANSASIIILLWVGMIFNQEAVSVMASYAILAAAIADTVSSDIGMLTQGRTFSILTGKTIKKGLSGGVSWLGLVSGLAAVILMVLPLIITLGFSWSILIIIGLGFLGTILDSVLGQLLQVKYKSRLGALTENNRDESGQILKPICGIRGINNDWINFISLSIIGIIGFLIFLK